MQGRQSADASRSRLNETFRGRRRPARPRFPPVDGCQRGMPGPLRHRATLMPDLLEGRPMRHDQSSTAASGAALLQPQPGGACGPRRHGAGHRRWRWWPCGTGRQGPGWPRQRPCGPRRLKGSRSKVTPEMTGCRYRLQGVTLPLILPVTGNRDKPVACGGLLPYPIVTLTAQQTG